MALFYQNEQYLKHVVRSESHFRQSAVRLITELLYAVMC